MHVLLGCGRHRLVQTPATALESHFLWHKTYHYGVRITNYYVPVLGPLKSLMTTWEIWESNTSVGESGKLKRWAHLGPFLTKVSQSSVCLRMWAIIPIILHIAWKVTVHTVKERHVELLGDAHLVTTWGSIHSAEESGRHLSTRA